MKALVTGMAGFIGSHLAGELAARGAEVVGIDCFTEYYPRAVKEANLATLASFPRVRFVEGAVESTDLEPLLDGVTHVFHFAARAGVRDSWRDAFVTYTANNINATQRLLEAVKDRRGVRLVYASSSSVYGDSTETQMREDAPLHPISPYGVTKLAAEHLCYLYHRNYGLNAVSLRYFTVYGPRQRPDMAFHKFIRAALLGQPITIYGDGEQSRDFTYVADAVRAAVTAAERGRPGAVYNIGGGQRITVNEVLERIAAITGRTLTIKREVDQRGDMRNTFADTTRAHTDFGYAPEWTLDQGLAAECAWLSSLISTAAAAAEN